MENREITLADIFLDILSESQDKGAKLMAERIKAAIKSPEILELVNICVINALGYKVLEPTVQTHQAPPKMMKFFI